ncbi:MAG: nitroreductase family protein [Limnochordaceae bacterium]|nr:nitroreductase family protein [Limnochordaceae bacterium]
MDALECLRTRRSIRQFTQQPVDRQTLEQLVDVARFAPTANNRQPWDFVVVTDRNKLQQLAQAVEWGKHIGQAAACIAVTVQPGTYAREDGANAATYLALAARAMGLGSCWVAGEPSPSSAKVKELLEIPMGVHLTCLLPIGYPAEDPTPDKRPLESVIHWDKY